MSFLERIAPQIMAARIQMPAWAMGAVPSVLVSFQYSSMELLRAYLSRGCTTTPVRQSDSHPPFPPGVAPPHSVPSQPRSEYPLQTPYPEAVRFDLFVRGGKLL